MIRLSPRDIIGGIICIISFSIASFFLFIPNLKDTYFLGVSDKVMHVGLFYTLTIIALFSIQKMRKIDILFGMVFFVTLTEVIQIITGRIPSHMDVLMGFLGIFMAILPLYSRSIKKYNLDKRKNFNII